MIMKEEASKLHFSPPYFVHPLRFPLGAFVLPQSLLLPCTSVADVVVVVVPPLSP